MPTPPIPKACALFTNKTTTIKYANSNTCNLQGRFATLSCYLTSGFARLSFVCHESKSPVSIISQRASQRPVLQPPP